MSFSNKLLMMTFGFRQNTVSTRLLHLSTSVRCRQSLQLLLWLFQLQVLPDRWSSVYHWDECLQSWSWNGCTNLPICSDHGWSSEDPFLEGLQHKACRTELVVETLLTFAVTVLLADWVFVCPPFQLLCSASPSGCLRKLIYRTRSCWGCQIEQNCWFPVVRFVRFR